MARLKKTTPSYVLHKASGRGRAVWYDTAGVRQQKLLPGPFESQESRKAFATLQLEIESSPLRSPEAKSDGVTVNQLMLAYLEHAEQHYRRPDGTPTNELAEYKETSRHVRELYAHLPAADFGPLCLKAVRQKFIAAGWSRGFINQRIGRVRRMWKWGVSEELVPAATHQALATVPGLQRGRSKARETGPVLPVDEAIVDVTVKYLNRHVVGMVRFQQLTGCRPGEVCAIRRRDLDMSEGVWTYSPPHHKTAWRGKARTISIGPKAQELLRPFFTPNLDDPLFSPRRAVEEIKAERSAKRKTPRYPSHMKRNAEKRKNNPGRIQSDRYSKGSFEVAIDRACDRAFPPPEPLAQRKRETAAAWKARLTPEQHAELKQWPSTIWRWIRDGLKTTTGNVVKLEAARVGNRWLTSKKAMERFFLALTEASTSDSAEPTPKPVTRSECRRRAASEAAGKKLDSMGA